MMLNRLIGDCCRSYSRASGPPAFSTTYALVGDAGSLSCNVACLAAEWWIVKFRFAVKIPVLRLKLTLTFFYGVGPSSPTSSIVLRFVIFTCALNELETVALCAWISK